QAAYVRDLVDRSDYPDFAIEEMAEMFKQWMRDKREGILDYRNKSYRSTITGTLAPPHHTPWMEAMDDSLEAFLRDSTPLKPQPASIAANGARTRPEPAKDQLRKIA